MQVPLCGPLLARATRVKRCAAAACTRTRDRNCQCALLTALFRLSAAELARGHLRSWRPATAFYARLVTGVRVSAGAGRTGARLDVQSQKNEFSFAAIGRTCTCQLCTSSHVLWSLHVSPGVYRVAYIAKVILNDMSRACGAEMAQTK